MKTRLRIASLIGMLIYAFSVVAQPSQSEAPAERRIKELVQFLNSGNRATYQKYVAENFAPVFMRIPMEQHLEFFSQLQDSTRGVVFDGVQDTQPNEVTARLKTNLTGSWMALLVRVEGEPPYRIAGIGMRPPKPPANAVAAKALSKQQMARELETFMKKLADADVFSGTVLLAKDGVPIFKGAYGVANKDFN
ncbi:MAG: hypothetical protein ABI882_18975, partial [Acidobacteriota bacterium]